MQYTLYLMIKYPYSLSSFTFPFKSYAKPRNGPADKALCPGRNLQKMCADGLLGVGLGHWVVRWHWKSSRLLQPLVPHGLDADVEECPTASNRCPLKETDEMNPAEGVRRIPRIGLLLLQGGGGLEIEAEGKWEAAMRVALSVVGRSAWTNILSQQPWHPWLPARLPQNLQTRSCQVLGCWGNSGEAHCRQSFAFSGVSYTNRTSHQRGRQL